ncbi:hypothetical protein MBSPM3_v1c4700 [Maize bushy stunt phytoplasma]|uniref:Uncharacterized protein n=2 Tax=Maize bushy stunt phytoplasma TaxID=202462 RepID=A0ABM6DMG7_9MOLU|nr:hypothetical protein MBSPM3_v1c4700 [Maize bushy stunt phytoplasma]
MRMFHMVKENEEDQTTQTQIKGHNNKSKRRTTINPQTPKRITKIKLKTNKRKIVFLSDSPPLSQIQKNTPNLLKKTSVIRKDRNSLNNNEIKYKAGDIYNTILSLSH